MNTVDSEVFNVGLKDPPGQACVLTESVVRNTLSHIPDVRERSRETPHKKCPASACKQKKSQNTPCPYYPLNKCSNEDAVPQPCESPPVGQISQQEMMRGQVICLRSGRAELARRRRWHRRPVELQLQLQLWS